MSFVYKSTDLILWGGTMAYLLLRECIIRYSSGDSRWCSLSFSIRSFGPKLPLLLTSFLNDQVLLQRLQV
jgi:hypothetical protein